MQDVQGYPIPQEKEMSARLRPLVDNCFQEGQYESGIIQLNRLRSPTAKPSVSHILQLVFMVLYPPLPEEESMSLILGSPRKLVEKQKAPLVPKAGVAEAALLLLISFIRMNHPLSLVSGFPRYADRNQDDPLKRLLSTQGSLSELESEESFSGKAALQIGQESCFWACLHPEFIYRISKSKDHDDFPVGSDPKEIIGETAWPVLDWFVQVIEREESMCNGRGSRILLYQIPAPRTGVGPRWDVNQVLEVIFSCFNSSVELRYEAQERRWLLGSRLLNSLLKLTVDENVSRLQLSNILSTRLDNVSPSLVSSILSSIQSDYSDLKIHFCTRHLTQSTNTSVTTREAVDPHAQSNTRKPRPRARKATGADNSTALNIPPHPQTSMPQVNIVTLTLSELTRILEREPPTEADSRLRQLIFKFHLLAAFSGIQRSRTIVDSEWQQFCSTTGDSRSQLLELVERSFPVLENPNHSAENEIRDAALRLVSMWQQRTSHFPSLS